MSTPENIEMQVKQATIVQESKKYKVYPQILAGFLASLAMFSSGLTISWPAPSLPKLQSKSSDLYLNSDQGAWVVSGMPIGACIGPIISALLVNHIGRKWFLYTTGISFILSWMLIYFAQSFELLFVGRIIGGISVGGSFSTVPMYLCEIAESRIRGLLITMGSVFFALGSVMVNSVAPWVDIKTAALINTIPAIIFLLGFIAMPETPYHHVRKDHIELAEKSLTWLRKTSTVNEELKEIINLIENEKHQQGKILELVTIPANRKATFITWLLLSAQQFSGAVALLSYITLILDGANIPLDSRICVIFISIIFLCTIIVVTFIVDRLGRKPLFLISIYGVIGSLFILATFFYAENIGANVTTLRWVPVATMVSFNIFSAIGLLPIPYTIISEIYPTSVKAWAVTVASIYGSIAGAAVSKGYQIIVDTWGIHVIFYLFSLCELIFSFLVLFLLPETKGKSFAEIQNIMNSGVFERSKDIKN